MESKINQIYHIQGRAGKREVKSLAALILSYDYYECGYYILSSEHSKLLRDKLRAACAVRHGLGLLSPAAEAWIDTKFTNKVHDSCLKHLNDGHSLPHL